MRPNDARLSAYEASIVVFMGIFHGITGSIPEVWSSSHGEGLTSGNADCSLGPRDRGAWRGRGYLHPVTRSEVRRPLHRQSNWLKRRPRCTGAAMRGELQRTAVVSADRWRFTTISNFEGSFLEFFIWRSDHHTQLSQRVAPLVFVTMHSYSQRLFLRYICFRKCS